MAKKLFRRIMVRPEVILRYKWLHALAPGLRHPSVWHLNRRSAARATAIGLFWALIPIPWQMIPAACCAVYLRSNIAIAVAMCWITNPLTWGPLWYGTYRLGRWMLNQPAVESEQGGWQWMTDHLSAIWQPLFLGSIVAAALLAVVGYFAADWLWRAVLLRAWNRRKQRVIARAAAGIS